MRTSRQEITQVLRNYDLGDLKTYRTIKDGMMNLNAKIHTTRGKFVFRKHALKQFENHRNKPRSIMFEHEILNNLYKNDFSVPIPLKNKRGETFTTALKNYFTIFPFI